MEAESTRLGNELKRKRIRNRRAKKKARPTTDRETIVDITVQNSSNYQEIIASKPAQYTYPVFIIQLAIQQRIVSFSSWRGIEKNFKLWGQFFSLPTPDFTTIRQWFLKLGLFQLQREKEKRSDWIFIIDTIFGQGQKKCCLILGLSYQQWLETLQDNDKNLQHHDLQVLALEVLDSTKGEILASKIEHLASTVGQPLQIISDHGSDLKKGIELYITKNSGVVYTYDFTHQVALWLKKDLSKNQTFQEFLDRCSLTHSQIQQTELAFLMPPTQQSKARYHNIDILVNWGLKVLEYWSKQDFSLISTQFLLDAQTLFILRGRLHPDFLSRLTNFIGIQANSFISFCQILTEQIPQEYYINTAYFPHTIPQTQLTSMFIPKQIQIVATFAQVGKRKFLEKLNWLFRYENDLRIWAKILEVFDLAKKQLIEQGLHQKSQQDWWQSTAKLPMFPWIQSTRQKVSQYLNNEGKQVPNGKIFPATSDIIESLFSKYKKLLSSATFCEINETILSLTLFTTQITHNQVLEALEKIKTNDVINWSKKVFGQSIVSKRKEAFANFY